MKIKTGIILFSALFATLPLGAYAEEAKVDAATNNSVVVESINSDDRFKAGEDYKTEGDFKSSIFFVGNKLEDDSNAHGISFLAGAEIKTTGTYDYGFHAAGTVTIDGEYKNDLFLAGDIINITKNAKIGRDLFVAGDKITIETDINGNVYAAGQTITLKGIKVSGNLYVAAEEIVFDGENTVAGTYKYNDNIKSTGEAKYGETEMYESTKFSFNIVSPVYSFNASLVSVAFKLIGYILVAAIASFVGRKFFNSLSSKTANYNFSAGLVDFVSGIAGIMLMPILALILLLTVVGIPISLIVLVIYIAMLYVAPVITAALIGDKIFKKQSNRLIKITLGLIIIELCELIPVVGGIIKTLTVFYGFGLMVKVWFSKN